MLDKHKTLSKLVTKGILPDTASEEILPKASVAIITGTALVNGTIDRLIELSKDAREIAVVGASATVLPDPLFEHGVTIVGGINVLDPDKLLQIVAEGGGTRELKTAIEFINLRPKNLGNVLNHHTEVNCTKLNYPSIG